MKASTIPPAARMTEIQAGRAAFLWQTLVRLLRSSKRFKECSAEERHDLRPVAATGSLRGMYVFRFHDGQVVEVTLVARRELRRP